MNAYKAANTNDGDKKKGAAAASAGKAGDAAAGERSGSGNANSNVDDETAEPKKMIRFTDEMMGDTTRVIHDHKRELHRLREAVGYCGSCCVCARALASGGTPSDAQSPPMHTHCY
mmetsp:Transcript_5568/g.11044  ORF Transcript_5568/g.11044 Transcript_5568/m.11044 type:complete len:116 (-) Transcript_5568:458-805(-)